MSGEPTTERAIIAAYRTHTGATQIQIVQLDDKDCGFGHRLAGPKHHNMGTTTLVERTLDAEDAREIRSMLDAAFPPVPAEQQPTPAPALSILIPGGDPERMSVVVTETTPDGVEHTWSGSFAALADRIAPAPAPLLSDAERTFLTFALDLASDRMATRGNEFDDDDWSTLATLRKLAGGES